MTLELWPAPHTGPTEGVRARWVEGANQMAALRKAVAELGAPPPAEEPQRPDEPETER